MNITIIATKLDVTGGGEKFDIVLTARALQEQGYRVQIVTTFSELNVIPEDFTVPVHPEQVPSKQLLPLQFFIVRILKKYAPQTDVFYLIGSTFLFGAGWYRLWTDRSRPVVAFLNGYADFVEAYFKKYPLWPRADLEYASGLLRGTKHRIRILLECSIGAFLINRLDAFVAMTKTIANYYQRSGVSKKIISVLPCFYDIEALQRQPLKNNPFAEFPPGTFHLVSVGRIYIDKGFDILLEAFARCRLPNAVLHIVGAGPLKSELKKWVRDRHLSSVVFHAWQTPEDLVAFYQHADLFVHPGRLPEAMVRTTVEAMALGAPLVVPGTSVEAWIAAEVAKTFKNGSSGDLAAKLTEAYFDKPWQAAARENGQRRAREFDYRRLITPLEKILQTAANRTNR